MGGCYMEVEKDFTRDISIDNHIDNALILTNGIWEFIKFSFPVFLLPSPIIQTYPLIQA